MLKLGRRDQTGRAPRSSSRGAAFYQSYTAYATAQTQPPRSIQAPSTEEQTPHTVEPQVNELYRGGGSGY